jgi:hypothetical protein
MEKNFPGACLSHKGKGTLMLADGDKCIHPQQAVALACR